METGREGGGEGCFGQARQFALAYIHIYIYTYIQDLDGPSSLVRMCVKID